MISDLGAAKKDVAKQLTKAYILWGTAVSAFSCLLRFSTYSPSYRQR